MNVSPSLTAVWTSRALGPVRALALAAEAGLLLVRDANLSLSLISDAGTLQGQCRIADLVDADIAADGSGVVIAGTSGRVAWLGLDLRPRWELQLGVRVLSIAVDSFGQYLAVADNKGLVHFCDSSRKSLGQFSCPRPIQHLAFPSAAPYLACAADFGWAGLLDLMRGDWSWSDRPVTNCNRLAVGATGEPLLLACFSEGLRVYPASGATHGTVALPLSCEQVAVSFDGQVIIAAGASRELFLCTHRDKVATLPMPHTPTALAMSARADLVYCGYGDGTVQCFRLHIA